MCESVGNNVSVGHPHIEHIIARHWLAATDHEIAPTLATLDLSESSDESALSFDWCTWVRTASGIPGPPTVNFTRGAREIIPRVEEAKAVMASSQPAHTAVAASADNLYGRRKRRPAVSRRLQGPSRNRLRVCWGKSVSWRFFSHLDMVRVIERALRKAMTAQSDVARRLLRGVSSTHEDLVRAAPVVWIDQQR
jgi:hypothetical protein